MDQKTSKAITDIIDKCGEEIRKIHHPKQFRDLYSKEPELDNMYNVDIFISRHTGDGNSIQIIQAENVLSILAATDSYLFTLLSKGLITPKDLSNVVENVLGEYSEYKIKSSKS